MPSLLDRRPEDVTDRFEPADLLAEVRALQSLTAEHIPRLDFILRQWTQRALARLGDVETLGELDDLAALSMRLLPDNAEGRVMRARWQAFADLLESKRLAIIGRSTGRAANLLHAAPIREALAAGPMPQSELQALLGVSAQRMSQVLGVMEEAGLVVRTKQGKEKLVALPDHEYSRPPAAASARKQLLATYARRPSAPTAA